MLQKCANNACSNPFRRLTDGKLFQVETEYYAPPEIQRTRSQKSIRPLHRIEHYWLCNECSSFLTISFDKGQGMITIPLPGAAGKKTVRALSFDESETRVEQAHIAASRSGC